MNERQDETYQAASMYYVQGDTMENIARRLDVSRSTVSRMLKDARDSGMVRITLTEPGSPTSALAAAISTRFGVRTHIVSMRDDTGNIARLERVARVAAGLANEVVQDGDIVGVAWGTTTGAVANQLPHHPKNDVTVVQLNGAANPQTSGIPYAGVILRTMARAWGAQIQPFPVPAFFDDPATRRMLWRERSISRILDTLAKADVAIFGVGSLTSGLPSHVYAAGYLDESDFAQLEEERVSGDVCTFFLRGDGSWRDIEINQRASGPNPEQLSRVKRRICVVATPEKFGALHGALRAGVATDLVVDDHTARALMQLNA